MNYTIMKDFTSPEGIKFKKGDLIDYWEYENLPHHDKNYCNEEFGAKPIEDDDIVEDALFIGTVVDAVENLLPDSDSGSDDNTSSFDGFGGGSFGGAGADSTW